MGASIYTLDWAEDQWKRLMSGEKLSDHDRHALLLVYRHSWLLAKSKLESTAYLLREMADGALDDAASSPEVVRRDGKWRLREDDESDERDL